MLLAEIKGIFHTELDEIYPSDEVDTFFYWTIEHFLSLERFVLVLQPELALTKTEEQPLFETLAQLKQEKPIQYILGKTHFVDLEFQVTPDVLIPRPETEELVRWIISEIHQTESKKSDFKILDIGTGSGCIAITLAKNIPDAKVYALDVSEKALKVAQENARLNGVDVSFLQEDILKTELELQFDIIVSNPPYVRKMEKSMMKTNVKDYEPDLALFVPNEDSLIFYKAIAEFCQNNLASDGKLYLEINQYLGKETKSLLEKHNFLEIELRKDLFGNDRMLKGKKP